MNPIVADRVSTAHRVLPETRPRMAKASLRNADVDVWKPRIGQAIQRALALRGWSLKEFAGAMDRDPRQCARWIDGSERPQLDVMFSVETLRQPLVIAFAELAGAGVEVTTAITIRRIA